MKTTKLFTAALLASALFVSACSQQTFNINGGGGKAVKNEMHSFFVAGVGQTQTVNAAAICRGADNVVRVEAQQTFINILITQLTIGIYAPRQYRVYCR